MALMPRETWSSHLPWIIAGWFSRTSCLVHIPTKRHRITQKPFIRIYLLLIAQQKTKVVLIPMSLYYNIGVFHDPNDPDAIYTTIANRRTWPLLFDWTSLDANEKPTKIRVADSSAPSISLLGAIDARQLDITLKPKNFTEENFNFWSNMSWISSLNSNWNWDWNSSNAGWTWYTITNMRTGSDFTDQLSNPQTYHIDFEPGEGTLLRVAPATAVEVGRTNSMAYNNGHRVAILSAPCTQQPDEGVVWEDNGKILFYVVPGGTPMPPPTSSEVQVIYDPQGNHHKDGHNPSIAAHGGSAGDVAIVYSIDDYVNGTTPSKVIFTKSTASSSIRPGPPQTLLLQVASVL